VSNPRIAWTAADCVEWTYERDEGDLVVFAKNQADALQTLREHGFTKLNASQLKRTGKNLAEHLASAEKVEIS
jgi:hypothetical protein